MVFSRFLRRGLMILCVLFVFVCTGCGEEQVTERDGGEVAGAEASGKPTELLISAAASLADALRDIQAAYAVEEPRVKLVFNFGASGSLQQQIEQGVTADLFISAATNNMKTLVNQGLVDPATQRTLLRNELVIVVPASGGGQTVIAKLEDLNDATVRHIAIGEPQTVPAGGYAKEALLQSKLFALLSPKLVQGKDVRQVLTYVESGNAEAGFVYRTDAQSSSKVKVAVRIDPSTYSPIDYSVGILKASKHLQEAEAFWTYLQSGTARDVFRKYGFIIP